MNPHHFNQFNYSNASLPNFRLPLNLNQPTLPVNQQPLAINRPPQPMATGQAVYPPNSINYPPPTGYYQPPFNQMQYYTAQQTYYPQYNQPPINNQMVNYPTANYMQYYQQSSLSQSAQPTYQLPPPSSTNQTTINLQNNLNNSTNSIQPVPPPPPPDMPKESPIKNQSPVLNQPLINLSNNSSITKSNSPSVTIPNEYSSFLNKFPTISLNASANTNNNLSDGSQNLDKNVVDKNLANKLANNQLNNQHTNQLNNKSNDQLVKNLREDKQRSKDDNLIDNNLNNSIGNIINDTSNNNLNAKLNTNLTESFPNTNLHNSNKFSSTLHDLDKFKPFKKQKIDVDGLDQEKVKNQLDQINQLKLQSQADHFNLMNKSQTLITEEDEYWLRCLNPEQKNFIETLKKQQKDFEDIYRNWEEDYREWRSKNITILDFETYQVNLNEWEDWKTNLLNRKVKLNQMCQDKLDDLKRQILNANPNIRSDNSKNEKNNFVEQDNFNGKDCFDRRDNLCREDSFIEKDHLDKKNDDYQRYNLEKESGENDKKEVYNQKDNVSDNKNDNFKEKDDNKIIDSEKGYDVQSDRPLNQKIANEFETSSANFAKNDTLSNEKNHLKSNQFKKQQDDSKKAQESHFNNQKSKDNNLSHQTTLFPSSKTMIKNQQQKKEQKKSKQQNLSKQPQKQFPVRQPLHQNNRSQLIEESCALFGYINQTREVLNIIDRLDFKSQQDQTNYIDQLEYIRQSIKRNSEESEDEDNLIRLGNDQEINQSFEMRQQPFTIDPFLSGEVKKFDLNSIFNKMQEIKKSTPSETLFKNPFTNSFNNLADSSIDGVTNIMNIDNQYNQTNQLFDKNQQELLKQRSFNLEKRLFEQEQRSFGQEQRLAEQERKLFDLNRIPFEQERRSFDLDQRQFDIDQRSFYLDERSFDPEPESYDLQRSVNQQNLFDQQSQPFDLKQAEEPNEKDFFSKFGIELAMNKVLSYKNMEYFLKPPGFTLAAEDLFEQPARDYRPNQICIILRGLPSSGKSKFVTLVCREELKHNAKLPKVFNFDEYLNNQKKMTELYNELNKDKLNPSLAEHIKNCRKFLFDDFSKVVKENKSNFVIFNSINSKLEEFDHFYIIARLNGYSTYIAEMDFIDYSDIPTSSSTDQINYEEYTELSRNWELTPASYIRLKLTNFVSTRNLPPPANFSSALLNEFDEAEDRFEFNDLEQETFFSKINLNDNLAMLKLDDFRMKLKRPIDEYWSLPDDYYQRKYSPCKRVRWLDVETNEMNKQW